MEERREETAEEDEAVVVLSRVRVSVGTSNFYIMK